MANSKLFLNYVNIGTVKLGNSDVTMYLGEELVYPLSSSVDITYDAAAYNGVLQTAQNIVVTDKSGNTLVESVDYVVTENSGGINAGSYPIVISMMGQYQGTASTDFVIDKVTPTVSAPTTISGLIYDSSQQALVNAGSTDYGTLKYSTDNVNYSTAIPSGTTAGTYTVYYKVDGDSNVNDVAAQTVSSSIAKVTPTVVAPTAKVLTYNAQAQELANVGSTDYGTLKYSTDGTNYSTSIPSETNAGTYTLYYRVDGDSNVNDVAAQTVACSIAKVTPTVVAPTAKVLTYNTQAQELVNSGSTDYGTLKYSLDDINYSTAIPSEINAGTYTVYYKVDGDSNVNDVATQTVACSIAKADSSLSFAVNKSTVGIGETKSNVVTVNAGDGVVTYTSNNPSVVTVDNNGNITGVASGDTIITAIISSTNNYNSASTTYSASCALMIENVYYAYRDNWNTKLANDVSSFKSVEVDGVEQPSVIGGYVFTAGYHTVKYYLTGTSIGTSAFTKCYYLTSVDIPSGVTSINNYAFYFCSGLTNCTIGDGPTYIGDYAFCDCDIVNLIIPDSVTTISNAAFNANDKLTSVTFGQDSQLTSIGRVAFFTCYRLTSIRVPSGVTSIGNEAFAGCSGLTSIDIQSAITSIGNSVFERCVELTSVTINAPTPPTLGTSAFTNANKAVVYVQCDSVSAYRSATNWSTYAYKIKGIGCPAIEGVINVTNTTNNTNILNQPSGFTKIEIDGVEQPSVTTGYTFSTTGNHTVKYYLSDKTIVVDYSFYQCTDLTSVIIPDSVTSIGNGAFYECSGLTSIGAIGSGASVEIPDSVTSIGNSAFYRCSGITNIDIPDNITNIGTDIFSGCTSLSSCTIGSGLTSISDRAFGSCTSLNSINIPDSITYIGQESFKYCSGLTSVTIPDTVTSIGNYAFSGCTSLTSIDIPSGVTYIGSYSFYYCSGLTSVTIGSGVTSIGGDVFYGCSSLTIVTVDALTPPTLGPSAFIYTNNCPIYVSCDSVDAYRSATNWSDYANRIKGIGCPTIEGVINVTNITNQTKILNQPSGFTKIEIDGVEQPSVTTGYTFSTTGNHTVKYYLSTSHIENASFVGCINLTSIGISDNVTNINFNAFRECSGLTSCAIGSGVTSIGTSAFMYCRWLTNIICNASTAPTIQSNTFQGVNTNGTLTVPIGSSGYDVWMQNANYYLGLYNWTKVEQ